MSSRSLKTTTAIVAALSLLQPLPMLAQAAPEAEKGSASALWDKPIGVTTLRSFEQICAGAQILEAEACEVYIMRAQAEQDANGAARAEAEAEAAAAARLAAEAEAARIAADAEAQAKADVEAARVAADAEAKARSDAEAEAARKAEAEAEAVRAAEDAAAREAAAKAEDAATDAAAKAPAKAAAKAAAEAEAAAVAAAAAETTARIDAEAQATEKARAEADLAADADAKAAAEAKAAADATAVAPPETPSATAPVAQTPTATDPAVPPAAEAETCLATTVAADGTITCIDTFTAESIAAIAEETDRPANADVAVTTETVTETTRRSSGEEFRDQRRDAPAAGTTAQTTAAPAPGLSDLEKAGLFVLGAVVVGAILSNGQRVEANTGDRVVVVDDAGAFRVLKDDDALLRQPGSEVRTERFTDGSTRTTVNRADGTQIVTIRDSSGRALRRTRFEPDGRATVLIDDTRTFAPVIVRDLPKPDYAEYDYRAASDEAGLRAAMLAADRRDLGRSFSLRQVRDIAEVRALSPEINLEAITFATNSAALQPSQAEQLGQMGRLMRDLIVANPSELFLIEGHTDAVGRAGSNLLLSDRRAESVALALTEYFGVPAENMIVQGYGESFLKIPTQEAERLNRRVAVRRITPLVR